LSNSDESNSLKETAEQKFLAAEYQALITLDGARNERLDRLLTTFVTLAAAPWALYALTLKDHSPIPSFSEMPPFVAAAFGLIGVLGALVAMMYIQVWFSVVLYMRAVNAIRGYFLEANTLLSFHLPVRSDRPPYYDKGNYIQLAVGGMALVNSGYAGVALFILFPCEICVRVLAVCALVLACWLGQMYYFYHQADKRDRRSKSGSLQWKK